MISLAMLFWIGHALSAPALYWWGWCILAFSQLIKFGWNLYKKGMDRKDAQN